MINDTLPKFRGSSQTSLKDIARFVSRPVFLFFRDLAIDFSFC